MSVVSGLLVNPYDNPAILEKATTGGPGRQLQNVQTQRGQRVVIVDLTVNHLKWTDDLTQAVWVKAGGQTISTSTTDVPGKGVANSTTVTGSGEVYQDTASFNSGDKLFFNVWLKAASATTVTMKIGSTTKVVNVGTSWGYHTLSVTLSATGTVRIALECSANYSLCAPMLFKGDENFTAYVKSTGTLGVYRFPVQMRRLTLTEGTGKTAIKETADDYTAMATEN